MQWYDEFKTELLQIKNKRNKFVHYVEKRTLTPVINLSDDPYDHNYVHAPSEQNGPKMFLNF